MISSEPEATAAWLVVNTHPHKEGWALEHLARQEYLAYCPMVRRRIKHARRVSDVLRPLFPGYLFVQTAREQRWRPIGSTFGVRALVRDGDRIGRLPHRFMVALRAREVDGAIVRPETPYRLGQDVRMNGGPFDALIGTIISLDHKDRVMVLMQLLHQSVRVKVDAASIIALSGDQR